MGEWLKPSQLTNLNKSRLEDQKAAQAQVCQELRTLVNSRGYSYVRAIAQEIKNQYKTDPPKKDEDRTKWNSYCQIAWAIDQLLNGIEKTALTAPAQTLKERLINASSRRKSSKRRKRGTNR